MRSSQPNQANSASGPNPPPGYFDNLGPQLKERSTVGSASATGSAGGRTTWASGSVDYDGDKMSEDQDDGVSSVGGFSDGNASLVGFGEGAGSTVSAPISTATSRAIAARLGPGSPSAGKTASPAFPYQAGTPMSGMVSPGSMGEAPGVDPRADLDTAMQSPPAMSQPRHLRSVSGQAEGGDQVMRDDLERTNSASFGSGGERQG